MDSDGECDYYISVSLCKASVWFHHQDFEIDLCYFLRFVYNLFFSKGVELNTGVGLGGIGGLSFLRSFVFILSDCSRFMTFFLG